MPERSFYTRLLSAPRPVLVEVWAAWCAPCRAIEPILQDLAEAYTDRVDVLRLDADENPEVVRDLGVIAIPTLIAFHEGNEVARHTGAAARPGIARLFEAARSGETPVRLGPNLADRLLRVVAGLAMLSLSLRGGWMWLLAPFGVAALFSAVYDRCPLWKAMAPRLAQALQRWLRLSDEAGET
jgi:thioredoxin 1